MDSLVFKSLTPNDLKKMYQAFLDSFSDYQVPFNLSWDQFLKKFVEKLQIDFELSVGAFHEETLVSFIFSAVGEYEKKLTVYNGGTGVRPKYRGKHLTRQMYNFLTPLLKERGIEQCVLEVLTQNDRAIRTYQSIGFKKRKYFKCYKLTSKAISVEHALPIEILPVEAPDWEKYSLFYDFNTSFLDAPAMINNNLNNEQLIEVRYEGHCIGYAIYQAVFGRISQIGVAHQHRRQGIGSALVQHIYTESKQKSLTVININNEDHATQRFFQQIGFQNQLDQYEMALQL